MKQHPVHKKLKPVVFSPWCWRIFPFLIHKTGFRGQVTTGGADAGMPQPENQQQAGIAFRAARLKFFQQVFPLRHRETAFKVLAYVR